MRGRGFTDLKAARKLSVAPYLQMLRTFFLEQFLSFVPVQKTHQVVAAENNVQATPSVVALQLSNEIRPRFHKPTCLTVIVNLQS